MASLGQAIANEFARIAALLSGGGPFGYVPGGSRGGSLSPIPRSPSPPVTGGTPPPPPGTGTPPVPIGPIIDVYTPNLFPVPVPTPSSPSPPTTGGPPSATPGTGTPPTTPACPTLTAGDYLTLVGLQSQAHQGNGVQIIPGQYPVSVGRTPYSLQATGIPVEIDDVFRFRAFGSAGAVPVSFFGRVAGPSGEIVPFNHVLTTDAIGTVIETMPHTGPGMLLGAAASVPLGSITSGAVNAVAEIGKLIAGAFIPHTLLFSGQVSDTQPLSSAVPTGSPPVTNALFVSVASGASSNSFVEISVTPTTGKRVRVMDASGQFASSATAGFRGMALSLRATGAIAWYCFAPQVLPVSSFIVMGAAVNSGAAYQVPAAAGVGYPCIVGLPNDLYFTTTFTIRYTILNSKAGDTISLVSAEYEET